MGSAVARTCALAATVSNFVPQEVCMAFKFGCNNTHVAAPLERAQWVLHFTADLAWAFIWMSLSPLYKLKALI